MTAEKQRDESNIECPECGEPMTRDRRFLMEGHTPFRCSNGHWAVDDDEPIQRPEGGFMPIPRRSSK